MNASGIEDRILTLEISVRRHRLLIGILAAALVVFQLVIPFMRGTVTAGAFVLESGGVTRASLASSASGTPALSLYDAAGNARLVLTMREDGSPDITMNDSQGVLRAALRVSQSAVPTLFFTDSAGVVRAAMGVPADGLPALVLVGEGERVRYMTP